MLFRLIVGLSLLVATAAGCDSRPTAEEVESAKRAKAQEVAAARRARLQEGPANLDEALVRAREMLTEEQLEEFREVEDTNIYHHGLGTHIRNEWGLWSEDAPLVQWFNSRGISHPDDISSIVLKSLHRQENGEPLKVDEQIQYYVDYWARVEARRIKYTDKPTASISPHPDVSGSIALVTDDDVEHQAVVRLIAESVEAEFRDCHRAVEPSKPKSRFAEMSVVIDESGAITKLKSGATSIPSLGGSMVCFRDAIKSVNFSESDAPREVPMKLELSRYEAK